MPLWEGKAARNLSQDLFALTQEVGDRQQQRLLLGEPGLGGFLLAGRAVAVATGVVAVANELTGRAGVDVAAERLGTTLGNGLYSLLLARRQRAAKARAVGGPIAAEDVQRVVIAYQIDAEDDRQGLDGTRTIQVETRPGSLKGDLEEELFRRWRPWRWSGRGRESGVEGEKELAKLLVCDQVWRLA